MGVLGEVGMAVFRTERRLRCVGFMVGGSMVRGRRWEGDGEVTCWEAVAVRGRMDVRSAVVKRCAFIVAVARVDVGYVWKVQLCFCFFVQILVCEKGVEMENGGKSKMEDSVCSFVVPANKFPKVVV
jgi:hypothetical protein